MEQLINTTDSADGEESDAGEADVSNAERPVRTSRKDLRDGPRPGWKKGRIALDAYGIKAETIGLPCGYERHASMDEDDPEGHIIRGQE